MLGQTEDWSCEQMATAAALHNSQQATNVTNILFDTSEQHKLPGCVSHLSGKSGAFTLHSLLEWGQYTNTLGTGPNRLWNLNHYSSSLCHYQRRVTPIVKTLCGLCLSVPFSYIICLPTSGV